jgi:hypothetical protein
LKSFSFAIARATHGRMKKREKAPFPYPIGQKEKIIKRGHVANILYISQPPYIIAVFPAP